MLTQEETLTFERTVQASPSDAYHAFTSANALRSWLCNAAQVDPRKGGRIYLSWNNGFYTAGVFTDVQRDERLAFTWRGPDDPSPSEVQVTFEAQDGSTRVVVRHPQAPKIWEDGLENLQSILETGVDLRFARRPMFGLNGGGVLDAGRAAELGVPVTEGMYLDGVVEGMGAQAAGMQKGDVVVRLAGHDITNFPSFVGALEGHRAGDRVPVVFYRGAERHEVEIELSARPMPEYPASAEELARLARETYAALDEELDRAFEGVTEEQADYRPAADAWNAKEIIGHLIAVERDLQAWITALIEEADIENIFHSNTLPRLQAMVSVHPTVPEIVAELKRSKAETAALLASLPEQVVRRKHYYHQIASEWTGLVDHQREHFAEVRQLVESSA